MAIPQQAFSVILRSSIPTRERDFLGMFCRKLTSEQGDEDLLELPCTKVDASHFFYIEVEAIHPIDGTASILRIPHSSVFLIAGSQERPSIGFTAHGFKKKGS